MSDTGEVNQTDRASSLFTYLREFAQLRSKIIRDIADYDNVLWYSHIPREPECFTPAWDETKRSGYEDIWLKIEKPNFRPFPPVPDKLKPWVREADLANSSDIPDLLERILAPDFAKQGKKYENEIDSEQNQGPQFLELSEHPNISELWDNYLEKRWLPWTKENERLKKIQQVYARLHGIYQQQKRRGEAYELVLGLGLLTWKTPAGQNVRRHLITAQASVEMDERGTLFVGPGAEGPKLSLEQDMIEADERPAPDIQNNIDQKIQEIGDDIWNISAVGAALRTWVHAISAEAVYSEELNAQTDFPQFPRVTFAPALMLRRRGERSLVTNFQEIINQIKNGVKIPFGIQRIIETIDDTGLSDDDIEDSSKGKEFQDTFFPLPTNDEQKKIIEYLRQHKGVLVQGPPGTGKSHTIVNLICHLIATGKRVLVTSQTPRALKVLKGMLPQEIAPLCVSLLGNDSQAFTDLGNSVQGITGRHQSWDSEQNEKEITRLKKELDEFRRREALLERRMREIRERETYEHRICDGAYSGTAQSIAERISWERSKYDWLDIRVELEASPPLSNEEALELLKLHRELYGYIIDEAEKSFVKPEALPSIEVFIRTKEAELKFKSLHDQFTEIHSTEIYKSLRLAQTEKLTILKRALEQLLNTTANLLKNREQWVARAVMDILSGLDRSWRELLAFSCQYLQEIKKFVKEAEAQHIDLSDGYDASMVLADAKALLEHFKSGGGLGWPFLRPKVVKKTWYLIKNARVNGQSCDNSQAVRKLYNHLMVDKCLYTLWSRWASHVPRSKGSRPEQVGILEDLCVVLDEVCKLRAMLTKSKDACIKIEGLLQPAWHDIKNVKYYLRAIQAVYVEKALREAGLIFDKAEKVLRICRAKPDAHEVITEIYQSVIAREEKRYASALRKLAWLAERRYKIEKRNELQKTLANVVPMIASHLGSDPHQPYWDERFSYLTEAWRWAKANTWLNEYIGSANEAAILSELEDDKNKISQVTSQLAAAMAWRNCLGRVKESERRALMAWSEEMKMIRAGKTKRAEFHRRRARQHMQQCRSAIPAWIMPLYRVAETVKPGVDAYDVVIIDEASQSGPDALFLLYLAKKIVVVGDEEQISPENIGIKRETVDSLLDCYLKDLPSEAITALGVESSFYVLAKIIFGSRITLREHFRCMPEIIQFSNNLCYTHTPLEPLRQYPPNRLEPVVTYHVKDGYREGDSQTARNRPEAEALVKTIARCCQDPHYEGKSMGVISLLGEHQARLIEHVLLEEIGPEEIEQRNIVCGDAYAFQGDERDVMFLSMVAAPGDTVMRALTRMEDKRRFNVAASRARDQMWLFHTPTLNDFKNKDCLRYKLLNYCLNPKQEQTEGSRDKCENDFERAVYDKIVERGYRVIPQFKVAGYFIDLVVEGMKGRLAVECDGDRWHSDPEQRDKDMRRQRILERCRWTFWRVRGGEFYRDPDAALEGLWIMLDRLDIRPKAEKESIESGNFYQGTEKSQKSDEYTSKTHNESPDDKEGILTSKEVMDNTESHLEESNGVKSKEPSQQVPYKTVDMSEKKRSKKSASKKKVIELITPRDEELIRWVPTIESDVWFAVSHWAKENNELKPWERMLAYSIGVFVDKKREASAKQARNAFRIYHEALRNGFDNKQ